MGLDIIPMQECETWHHVFRVQSFSNPEVYYTVVFSGPEARAICNCPAWQHSEDAHCKHIQHVFDTQCFWHQNWCEEQQTKSQANKNICPRCKGRTINVMVGV